MSKGDLKALVFIFGRGRLRRDMIAVDKSNTCNCAASVNWTLVFILLGDTRDSAR